MSFDLQVVVRELRSVEAEIARLERVAESYRTIINYKTSDAPLELPHKEDSLKLPSVKAKASGASKPSSGRRSTGDFKRPEFRDVLQKDAVRKILSSDPMRKFKTDELICLIYDAKSEAEFKAAKSSLGSALSRGIQNGDWKGASGQYYLEEKQSDLFEQQSAQG